MGIFHIPTHLGIFIATWPPKTLMFLFYNSDI